jgi:hypothetical protein
MLIAMTGLVGVAFTATSFGGFIGCVNQATKYHEEKRSKRD